MKRKGERTGDIDRYLQRRKGGGRSLFSLSPLFSHTKTIHRGYTTIIIIICYYYHSLFLLQLTITYFQHTLLIFYIMLYIKTKKHYCTRCYVFLLFFLLLLFLSFFWPFSIVFIYFKYIVQTLLGGKVYVLHLWQYKLVFLVVHCCHVPLANVL